MTSSAAERLWCSDLSIEAGEPLIATATPTRTFLLLEYNGAWGEKALEESDLPADVKQHLKDYAKSDPACKLLLIRSLRGLMQPGIRFFVARTGGPDPAIYDFHMVQYEDLLDLDIPRILSGDPVYANRHAAPLYLVCTNGRRDRCCARYGTEVFNALLETTAHDADFVTWQCSHIGGHRFAANVIALPAGVFYGRVRPADVPALVEAGRQGRIHLPNLRGYAVYPQPAQAADAALRRHLDEDRFDALRLEALEVIDASHWEARFRSMDRMSYRVLASRVQDDRRVYDGCALDKTTPIVEYRTEIVMD